MNKDRGQRRRQARAEKAVAQAADAASTKQEIARRKLALRQTFRDRHKLRLTFREKVRVVLGLFVAATGGPLYWWLPDELRFQPYRRDLKQDDRA